jgi:hypothetical protein
VNKARLAILFREIAAELERDEEQQRDAPAVAPPRKRKAARRPYVPNIEISEVDRARARQRARKMGIPLP